ncbi:Big [Parasponia andersonii]|uniref:Big n=1 Tax=Parasponia andersonii TaxID=3476 RepID=A0A2P5D062_PARAD|nr:Big [Parasponia andersonii]
MEQIKDSGIDGAKGRKAVPPPPPPPIPRFWVRKTVPESVTKQEIARFWRQKRIEEEDHLLAAIKAAARVRARNLSEEDYKCFEESLTAEGRDAEEKNQTKDQSTNEIRIGIKDWWTKSKYAYLNQPAIESKDPRRRRTSTYVPNCFSYKPTPLYPTSLGVF